MLRRLGAGRWDRGTCPSRDPPIPKHEEIVKTIAVASLMCVLVAPVFGQQQPPAPEAPAPQQQNQAATTAPPEISKDDPDYGEPFGAYFWLTKGPGKLLPGTKAAEPIDQILALPDVRPRSFGVFASMPAGKFNHLE